MVKLVARGLRLLWAMGRVERTLSRSGCESMLDPQVSLDLGKSCQGACAEAYPQHPLRVACGGDIVS